MHKLRMLGLLFLVLLLLLQCSKKLRGIFGVVIKRIALLVIPPVSRIIASIGTQFSVEGLENVPRTGAVLIAARHYHHFYDGCIMLGVVPRRLHIFVALDWARSRRARQMMEGICRMAEWPIALRPERLKENEAVGEAKKQSAYELIESRRYLLHAIKESVQWLRKGEVLVIFPEAYPNIDPEQNAKQNSEAFLPFRAGIARLVEMAERDGQTAVAIIPLGLRYNRKKRWQVNMRFGKALFRRDYADAGRLVRAIEERVHELSDYPSTDQ